jgi:hypothetical protein
MLMLNIFWYFEPIKTSINQEIWEVQMAQLVTGICTCSILLLSMLRCSEVTNVPTKPKCVCPTYPIPWKYYFMTASIPNHLHSWDNCSNSRSSLQSSRSLLVPIHYLAYLFLISNIRHCTGIYSPYLWWHGLDSFVVCHECLHQGRCSSGVCTTVHLNP